MPTYIYQLGSDNYTLGVYYTPTVEHFGQEHLPYAVLAIALSFLFVLTPLLTLFLYPFQFFQKFLSIFPFNWTFFKPFLTPIKVVTRMERNREHSTVDGLLR